MATRAPENRAYESSAHAFRHIGQLRYGRDERRKDASIEAVAAEFLEITAQSLEKYTSAKSRPTLCEPKIANGTAKRGQAKKGDTFYEASYMSSASSGLLSCC